MTLYLIIFYIIFLLYRTTQFYITVSFCRAVEMYISITYISSRGYPKP